MRANKGFAHASNAKSQEQCCVCGIKMARERMRREEVGGKSRWACKFHKPVAK